MLPVSALWGWLHLTFDWVCNEEVLIVFKGTDRKKFINTSIAVMYPKSVGILVSGIADRRVDTASKDLFAHSTIGLF